MDKHYFIGIPMPEPIQTLSMTKVEELKLPLYYKSIPHAADLHITLLFIGGFPKEKLKSLQEILRRIALNHQSFSLQINGVSSFGSNRSPRVIYLSTENSEPLKQLNREIVEKAGIFLSDSKKYRFVPHVTIGKKWKGVDGFTFAKQSFSPIEVDVNSYTLFEINPSQTPKYKPVESYDLK